MSRVPNSLYSCLSCEAPTGDEVPCVVAPKYSSPGSGKVSRRKRAVPDGVVGRVVMVMVVIVIVIASCSGRVL